MKSETKKLVVHCKREDYDVYIGRGSKWGNPYTHKQGTKAKWVVPTVEEAIQKYIEWFSEQEEFLKDLPELKGKVLGCWCAGPDGLDLQEPYKCHGQILAILANNFNKSEK